MACPVRRGRHRMLLEQLQSRTAACRQTHQGYIQAGGVGARRVQWLLSQIDRALSGKQFNKAYRLLDKIPVVVAHIARGAPRMPRPPRGAFPLGCELLIGIPPPGGNRWSCDACPSRHMIVDACHFYMVRSGYARITCTIHPPNAGWFRLNY